MRMKKRRPSAFEFHEIHIIKEKNMSGIALRLAVQAVGIALTVYIVPGIEAAGYGPIIMAAILLGILNLIIKPLLFILTLPINILSLGLFTFILNGIMLLLVGALVSGFDVMGLGVAILGSIVISLFSIIVGWLVR